MANKPGTRIITGKTEVVTEQTPVQLFTASQEFTTIEVQVQADPSNVGALMAVGDKNVNAKKTLGSTRGVTLEKKQNPVRFEISDPSQLWVDAEKGKDFVCWMAVLA